jgi:GNAT superfamily N-acetyltransferase
VVVYRRIVIAFAFLVPDVSHSEAYISFIFTHPEWRRAGIAKFMLYHLCQVPIFILGTDVMIKKIIAQKIGNFSPKCM